MKEKKEGLQNTKNGILTLVIYDIVNDKGRRRMVKFLWGYGFRVQKSAFEAVLSKENYLTLVREAKRYVTEEDSLRIYKINGSSEVTVYEGKEDYLCDDVIIA